MPSKSVVLLFDIDGTLLSVPGKGIQIYSEAVKSVFGNQTELPHKTFSGKTDWEIYRETMIHCNIPDNISDSIWNEFKEIYYEKFRKSISMKDMIIHNNAFDLLDYFNQVFTINMGLLTGNLKSTAFMKLKLANMDSYFSFGAYGDDHWQREELGQIALSRIPDFNQENSKIFIIGDTPRDIDVAKHMGAVSIAVTTGKFGFDNLKSHGADFVIHDLNDAKSIIVSYF